MDFTSRLQGLSTVIKSTAPFGYCTSGSIYFAPTTSMPLSTMSMKGIRFNTGRVNSVAQLDRVLSWVGVGLDPESLNCPVNFALCQSTGRAKNQRSQDGNDALTKRPLVPRWPESGVTQILGSGADH